MLEPKHQQLLAVIRGEKPLNLNVPLGKSEDKLQTLLGLVVDLREDNERLHQENSYLRQLLQELESNPNLAHRWFAAEPETAASPPEPTAEQEIIPAAEPAFDWEALYFDTQPALSSSHGHGRVEMGYGHGMNGYHSNGNGHNHGHANGHSNGAYVVYAPPPTPAPPPVESISLETLMQEITPPPTAKPTPTAVFAKPDPKPAFNAILRDPVSGRRIAEVALEGSLITSRDLSGNERRVWGFRLLQGSVQSEWRRGKHLYLCLKNGTAVRVRVAGLPSDESNHGYVEFV
jgi:hypothetical protein